MATGPTGSCKIGKNEWIILACVVGVIDFVQIVIIEGILVWLFGIGIVINEILDPIVGICLGAYFQLRGVNLFSHLNRLASMLGMLGLEEITGGVAQLWILDVWYIYRDVKKEEAGMSQSTMNGARSVNLNSNGRREPPPIIPANQGGSRSVITTGLPDIAPIQTLENEVN